MTEKEKEKIYDYWYHKNLKLQDDVVTYENRYLIRDCDEEDHLESIISITRKKAFDEFTLDIFKLLNLGPYERKK